MHKKGRPPKKWPAVKANRIKPELDVGLGLTETGDALALFPLAALFEDGDTLEALQDVALDDEAVGALETFVL
jgi:hypothetical protein